MNNVNRIAQVKDSANNATTLAYDANGQLTGQTDPLSHTTSQTLDGLRRPTATTFADSSSANTGWNGLDQVVSATDPKGVQTTYQRNAFGEVTSESSPDTGTTSYQRDALGDVTQRTDANSNVTTYTRDALGRPTTVQYAVGHVVTYTYDASQLLGASQKGYLSSFTDPSGSTAYERDLKGRISKKTQTVNDNPALPSSFVTQYNYYRGQLSEVIYPSGMWIYYPQNGSGQITGVQVWRPSNHVWDSIVSGVTWTPLGQPKAWDWFNGQSASRSFDTDGRMRSNEFASYAYDAAGRMTGISQSVSASSPYSATTLTWTVGYDNRDRVTSFIRAGAGNSYTYDANSNRLTALSAVTRDTDLDSDLDGADYNRSTTQSLNIGSGNNRLMGFAQTVTKVQGSSTLSTTNSSVTYSLDANGNLTSDGLRSFDYDPANRLNKATITKDGEAMSISYLHNALGQRVFKGEPAADQYLPNETVLGQSFVDWLRQRFKWMFESGLATTSVGTAYTYGDQGILPQWAVLGSYDNGSASGTGRSEYVWLPLPDGSAIPVVMYRNGVKYAIHTDHLGTPRAMADESANPVWQWPYSAFGSNRPTGVLAVTTDPLQATTIQPTMLKGTTPTVSLDLRMPGQMADVETGAFYNYFRQYDARTGRYTQSDPIGLDGGWNQFGYVDGSPLMFADPMGLQPMSSAGAVGAAARMTIPSFTNACLANPAVCAVGLAGAGGVAAGTLLYPHIEPVLSPVVDACFANSHEKNCEALRKSILDTCAGLSGRKKFDCFAAAETSYQQCLQQK
jgi:RHS repeat-associated protein